MALTNIAYGAMASSDVINKNFLYLDNRITSEAQDTSSSISSILSNIATINTRLSEIAEEIQDNKTEFNSKLDNYKTKTKELVGLTSMVPNWSNCYSISNLSSYKVPKNGYILAVSDYDKAGNITVNGKSVVFKNRRNSYDNVSQLVVIPVLKGDVCSCSVEMLKIYFLPAKELSVSGF